MRKLLTMLLAMVPTISSFTKQGSGSKSLLAGKRSDYPTIRGSKVGSRRIYRNKQKADICRNFKFSY